MRRRSFLKRSTAAAASVLLAHRATAQRGLADECSAQRLPGVQAFTVREYLQRDAEGALGALAGIGLQEIELYGLSPATGAVFGLQPARFKEVLERNSLSAPVSHVGGDFENAAGLAELARELGVHTLVLAIAPEFIRISDGRAQMVGPDSLADVDRLAERLTEAGARYRELGLVFGYHNHHVELFAVDGETPLERLMSRTDPDLVKLELDIGWAAAAGVEPIDLLRKYAERIVACHMKDFDGRAPLPKSGINELEAYHQRLVAPGAGTLDYAAVLDAMDAAGVRHGFIEIDVTDNPLAAIAAGHEHLQQLRGC